MEKMGGKPKSGVCLPQMELLDQERRIKSVASSAGIME